MRLIILTALAVMMAGSAWAETEGNKLMSYNPNIIGHCLSTPQVKVGDREVVLKVIAAESANQSDDGMYLVAKVIVNRARMRGLTLEQVVKQRKQFSCLNSPKWMRQWCNSHFSMATRHRAVIALDMALNDHSGQFDRLTHYHVASIMPYWAQGKAGMRVGEHVFYEGIK